jgi:hypothetical protein
VKIKKALGFVYDEFESTETPPIKVVLVSELRELLEKKFSNEWDIVDAKLEPGFCRGFVMGRLMVFHKELLAELQDKEKVTE